MTQFHVRQIFPRKIRHTVRPHFFLALVKMGKCIQRWRMDWWSCVGEGILHIIHSARWILKRKGWMKCDWIFQIQMRVGMFVSPCRRTKTKYFAMHEWHSICNAQTLYLQVEHSWEKVMSRHVIRPSVGCARICMKCIKHKERRAYHV